MPAADIAALYIALVRFTAAVYPQRLDLVDQVLASCQEVRAAVLNPQPQARSIPCCPATSWIASDAVLR